MMRRFLICAILLTISVLSSAQKASVTGKVTDAADGTPLAGVAIIEKSGKASAISDIDGNYTISVAPDAVLTYVFLGMKDVEEAVGGRRRIDVRMTTDVNLLDDVMVVAYGTATKESFTGSAETVKAEKLKDRSVSNVTRMLDGQVAGVMTTSGGGQPGSGSDIIIRGFGSINASNSPLIVVDGIPYDGELSSINVNDIEGITVLKDASAGALYGARGANGVVMVTTKRGSASDDRIDINFSAKVGVNSRAIPAYETLGAKEYMEHMYRACYNDLVYTEGYLPTVAGAMTPDRLSRLILGKDNRYNIFGGDIATLFDADGKIASDARPLYSGNWIDEATAPFPIRQEYQFSISGKSDVSRYMASLGYLDEQGTLKTTSFNRLSARVGAEFTPYRWLEFGANINYAHVDSDFLGASGTEGNNVWFSAMLMAPIYPVRDDEGEFDYGLSRPAGAQNNRNCIATLFDDKYYSNADNVNVRAHLDASLDDLKFSTSFGADIANEYQTVNFNRHNGNAAGTGRLSKENDRVMSYTWNQLLSYKKEFGAGHTLDLLAGHEFYRETIRYMKAERTGFSMDGYDELGMGSTLSEAYSEGEDYCIDSFLARANYSYADKYYLSGSIRTDASSRFKKENRWGLFWSLGASWRMSQEEWMKGLHWLNNLTVKASYGVQGNDNIGSYYAWQSLYYMNYPNAGFSGAVIESVENPDITWEKNANLNLGIEFRMFRGFSGTIEWYNRKTSDLLLEYPMAISLGFPGYYANVGSMVNRGVDITLGYDIINDGQTYWNVTAMGSTVRNRVLSLTGNGEDINNGNYIIREGETLNTFYMARSAGIDPATGEQLYLAYEKDDNGDMIPGSEFATNDPTIATGSKWLCGSRIPIIYGSLSTSFRRKGFDMSLQFNYSLGGKVYDSVYSSLMEPSFVGQTYHINSLRAWSEPGQVTDVPRVNTNTSSIVNDRFLVDASYFSIKSICAGYSFEVKSHPEWKLRLFAAVDNLWLFTALKGLNPQSNFSGSTSYSYTPNRTVSIGVDFKF